MSIVGNAVMFENGLLGGLLIKLRFADARNALFFPGTSYPAQKEFAVIVIFSMISIGIIWYILYDS